MNDTSLAASFPLHTATPSASSSRLDEINEDEDEEDGLSIQTPTSQTTSNGSFRGQRPRKDWRVEKSPPPAIKIRSESPDEPATVPSPVAVKTPHVSQFLVRDDSGQQSISSLIDPAVASNAQYATVEHSRDTQSSIAGSETPKATTPTSPQFKPLPSVPLEQLAAPKIPEKSSQRVSRTAEVRLPKGLPEQNNTERPTTSATTATTSRVSERLKDDEDLYDLSRFDIKPKQKLGPRPVVAGEKKNRPMVASISSVPATYRPTMKKPDQSRPKSQGPIYGAVTGIPKGLPAPPPIPDMPEYNPRPVSRGSIKSLPSHKSTAMTPDKIRLMKAVELRKKQLRKSNPQVGSFVPPPDEEVPAVPSVPEPEHARKPGIEMDKAEEPVGLPERIQREIEESPSNKADSGIEMEYNSSRREAEKATEVEQPEESTDVPQDSLLTSALKPLDKPEPQIPRADTPRDIIGQFPEENQAETPPQTATNDDEFGEISTPRAQKPESAPDPMPSEHEQSPALPVSRHALAVDNATRSRSIDEPRPSEDATTVPTIVMEDGSRPLSALIKEARGEDSTASESESEEKSTHESVDSSQELEIPEKSIRRQPSDIAKRRRGFVEPLHLDDEIELTSDDELMDELQSATLQEAKPITVARSPVAHYFPRRPSGNSAVSDLDVHSVRTITVGDRASTMALDYTDSHGRLSPALSNDSPGHTRSMSTPLSDMSDSMSSMRRNVSSGISKRIQALTEKSSQESSLNGSPSSSRPTSPETSRTALSVQDQRQQTRSPPPNSRTGSFRAMSRHSSRISAYQSIMGNTTPPQHENNTVWNVDNDNDGGVGSVSVTARIVRPTAIESVDSTPDMDGELQPSQLVVSSHKREAPSQSSVRQLTKIDTNQQPVDSVARSGMSPTQVRESVDGTRTLHSASRFGRHKPSSPTADDFPTPPPSNKTTTIQPSPAPVPVHANDESVAHKEATRTSRFFKRMSNIGNKRRSTIAQSVASSASPASERGSVLGHNTSLPSSKDRAEPPPALTVGDLNIQFPDSLVSLLLQRWHV